MDIKEMQMSDIETRSAEIEELLKADDADVETLTKEVEELESRKKEIEAEVEKRKAEMAEAEKTATVIEEIKKEERKTMDVKELRNSPEYIDAFAEYIKGNEKQLRTLLSENATNGTIPVPELVYDIVKTAWEKEGIMSLVRKSYLKGNLKVGFEISGDDAVIHMEGGNAIDPENLIIGTVNLIPSHIKKVVQISDEAIKLSGESFLRYIYDELAYRIAKKCADTLLAKIEACDTVSTTTMVGVPVVTASSIAQGTIASALAMLSDEASNPVVVMNKQTWGAFKAVQYAGNFDVDPFENLRVIFNNSMTAYSAATTGVTYALVGDFEEGALANFPDGDEIEFKFDDISLKKQDLVEVLGKRYVAIEPVAPNAFVKIQK